MLNNSDQFCIIENRKLIGKILDMPKTALSEILAILRLIFIDMH